MTPPSPIAGASGSLAAKIRAAAAEIGYVACGFTSTAPFEEYHAEIERRAQAYPNVAQDYRRMAGRADPRHTTPWAEAIVICIRHYGKYALPEALLEYIGRNYLADRRQADCPDHAMPKQMTYALKALGLKVKRGGIPDRAAAARAGVVAIGRNGFAYTPEHGSWINIESWRINAPLPSGTPLPSPCPEGCHACLTACPTRAIEAPCRVRMDRCIAYLTYSAPEPIDRELQLQMGRWIYGCDVCQQVCPLNQRRWRSDEPAPWIDAVAPQLTPAAIAGMDFETYRQILRPLFWYIPDTEAGLARWRENARRALQVDPHDRMVLSTP